MLLKNYLIQKNYCVFTSTHSDKKRRGHCYEEVWSYCEGRALCESSMELVPQTNRYSDADALKVRMEAEEEQH